MTFQATNEDPMDLMSVDYQGIIPDMEYRGYAVYITSHHADLVSLNHGVFSLAHLCLPQNSLIDMAIKFIDSQYRQQSKNISQLSLF
jgi:hypothetical protein